MAFGGMGARRQMGSLGDLGIVRMPLLATPKGAFFDGDSITFGLNTITPFPSQFATNTGQTIFDGGVSSTTLPQMISRYPTATAPHFNAATMDTLCLLGGINDLLNSGLTNTDVQSSWQTYAGLGRATGYKVIIGTLLPTNIATWNTTKEGYRVAANAWLLANWSSFCDGVIDYASIPAMQNTANTYIYNTDQLHPVALGDRYLAELARSRFGLANVNDTTPTAYSFTSIPAGARPSTLYTSNQIQLVGFTAPASISVVGGQYQINGGAFTSAAGTVQPYDTVAVQQTTSASRGTQTDCTLTAGGVSSDYSLVTAPTSSYVGPGDVQTFKAWYGFRGYSNATVGSPCVDIIRASDSAIQTFSILATGALETASIATFLSATTGKISKIYDQTQTGWDLVQGTDAARPAYTASAVGSLPGMTLAAGQQLINASAFPTLAQPFSVSYVAERTGALTSASNVISGNNGASNVQIGFGALANKALLYANTITNAAANDNAFHAIQAVANGSSSSIYVDGTLTSSLNPGPTTFGGTISLGAVGAILNPLTGAILEAGIAAGNQSANNSAVNSNQHTYWGF